MLNRIENHRCQCGCGKLFNIAEASAMAQGAQIAFQIETEETVEGIREAAIYLWYPDGDKARMHISFDALVELSFFTMEQMKDDA